MPFAGSNIIDFNYDSFDKKLVVYFNNGSKYEYENVPYHRYSEMLESPKRTETFNNKIRDVFKFKKIY